MVYCEYLFLIGIVVDIYEYIVFDWYDYIFLDSLFYFGIKERIKEVGLLICILEAVQFVIYIIICIQDVGRKVEILNIVFFRFEELELVDKISFVYEFRDQVFNYIFDIKYEMCIVRKQA